MIGAHRDDADTDAAEIDLVLALERHVRLAECRILEQLGIDRRPRPEHLGGLHSELLDVLHLALCAQHPGRCRERLRTEVMLGMDMCRHQVHRARCAEPLRDLSDSRAVARTEPGVDHQHARLADHEADIGDERNAVVRDDMHVRADPAQPVDLDDRVRGICANPWLAAISARIAAPRTVRRDITAASLSSGLTVPQTAKGVKVAGSRSTHEDASRARRRDPGLARHQPLSRATATRRPCSRTTCRATCSGI